MPTDKTQEELFDRIKSLPVHTQHEYISRVAVLAIIKLYIKKIKNDSRKNTADDKIFY